MISADNSILYRFRGLSTDTQPIGNNCENGNVNYPISNGSTFFEIDTNKAYMLMIDDDTNNGTWQEITNFMINV